MSSEFQNILNKMFSVDDDDDDNDIVETKEELLEQEKRKRQKRQQGQQQQQQQPQQQPPQQQQQTQQYYQSQKQQIPQNSQLKSEFIKKPTNEQLFQKKKIENQFLTFEEYSQICQKESNSQQIQYQYTEQELLKIFQENQQMLENQIQLKQQEFLEKEQELNKKDFELDNKISEEQQGDTEELAFSIQEPLDGQVREKEEFEETERISENQNLENTQEFFSDKPQNYQEFLDDILKIIKHQLFILDSIWRLDNYDKTLSSVWRFQINALTEFQRFNLWIFLKKLKRQINFLKQFNLGIANFLIDEKIPINLMKNLENSASTLKKDLEKITQIDINQVQQEIENLFLKKQNSMFKYTNILNDKITQYYLKIVLRSIDFQNFTNEQKILVCKLCQLKSNIEDVINHFIKKHFDFFQYFDTIFQKCIDYRCRDRNNCKPQNVKKHTLKNHSQFYKIEKPFRHLALNLETNYYTNARNLQKDLLRDLNKTLSLHSQEALAQLEYLFLTKSNCDQKYEFIFQNLEYFLLENNKIIRIENLEGFDNIAVFLRITWNKIYDEIPFGKTIKEIKIPKYLDNMMKNPEIYTLEYEEKIIELIYGNSYLKDLRNKLILGFFNSNLTNYEKEKVLKVNNEITYGLALANTILYQDFQQIEFRCFFNKALCNDFFQTREETFKHFFFGHSGLTFCLSSNKCNNILNMEINEAMHHCHDVHKGQFTDFIKDFLKEEKNEFMLKAVCAICQKRLTNNKEIFWSKTDKIISRKFAFEYVNVTWKNLIKSHKQQFDLDKTKIEELQKNFRLYVSLINLQENEEEKPILNDKGFISVCKQCQNKPNKFSHFNEQQFANQNHYKLIPLAQIYGSIRRTSENGEKYTYPRVLGNLRAIKNKALIIFKDLPIVLTVHSKNAKIRDKFQLRGRNDNERLEIVKTCLKQRFLSNHCYQMCSMSQMLIRQQEQLLTLNKKLLKNFLKFKNVQQPQDKLQLEFQKFQDLVLFDDLIHRTQIYYLYQKFYERNDLLLSNFKQEFLQIIYDRKSGFQHDDKLMLLEYFEKFDTAELDTQHFLKLTISLYLFCEQIDPSLTKFKNPEEHNSIIEMILIPDCDLIFFNWIRQSTLLFTRELINNNIHPLYIGIIYQKIYMYEKSQGLNLTVNLEGIVESICQVLAIRATEVCLPNHKLVKVEMSNELKEQKKRNLIQKNKLFYLQFLHLLDDQQYYDMDCRFSLINEAFDKAFSGKELEELWPSDLRWTMQNAQFILSCLKAQRQHVKNQDREILKKILDQLQPLEKEVKHYFTHYKPIHKRDFLSQDYRDELELILKEELNPLQQDNYKSQMQYTFVQNMYLVFFIGVEEKFKNMEKTITILRQIFDKEPFYTVNKYYNVGSFQKELEFALFPNLYPNSEGGFNTKIPALSKVQLVLDIANSEKQNAIRYVQNLREIRNDSKQEIHQEMRKILSKNQLNFGLELNDFTTKLQFGIDKIAPNKAIFNLVEEEFINENQSMNYVFQMQKLSALQYEQARILALNDNEVEQHLPQIIDVQLVPVNNMLAQTISENHISTNLEHYLKQNQQDWDNEIQEFKKQMSKEKQYLKKMKKTDNEIQTFQLEQERLLISQKIRQLAQNNNLIEIAQRLRTIVRIDLSSDVSSEESDIDSVRRDNIQKVNKQIRNNFQTFEEYTVENFEEKNLTKEEKLQIKQAKEELAYFSRSNIALSQDTKWRLKCTFTKEFRKNVNWIFWRYYEWMKQEFYCYQLIVNNEKGITQGNDEYTSIPPIRGSETQLTEYFHQIQKFSFEKGDPLMMLTITLNEFSEKTFKIMRGLNQFDLENEAKVGQANKKTLRDPEIIELAHDFVEYMIFLLKIYKKVLLNKFGKKKQRLNKIFSHYQYGLFGNCHNLVTRVEYQERGAIHFHIFIFNEVDENGEVDIELLKYLQGLFSMYNITIVEKDSAFIKKYKLTHECNKKCQKEKDASCRDGFPFLPEIGVVRKAYPTILRQRRMSSEDARVITFNKETVRFFNSNCQLVIISHVSIYAYLTKYFSKAPNKKRENTNIRTDEFAEREEKEDMTIMTKIKEFFDTKMSHLQEAYSAFQSFPILNQTYKVIKIRQQHLSFQSKLDQQPIDMLTEEEIEEYFKFNNLSNNWYLYLNRSYEFEDLNFVEYVQNTINYGKKETYKKLITEQTNNIQTLIENYIYFYDLKGNVIKIREKKDKNKMTIIQTTHIHPSPDYKGPENIYHLQMLQLYLPHRKEIWIRKTKNTFQGYKEAYEEFIDTFTYEVEDNSLRTLIRKRFAKFKEYPLKNYVKEYLDIKPRQKRMLENIYRFAFNLKQQDNENLELPTVRQDFIEQILNSINQQLDVEFEYKNASLIKTLIDIFNPLTIKDELMIAQLTDLLEDLKKDVKFFWKELNFNTKNILMNLSLIYKEYGSTELYDLIPNVQNTTRRISQKQLERQNQNSQTLQEVTSQQVLSQIQDVAYESKPQQYRNVLTQQEYEETKRRRQLKWILSKVSNDLLNIWATLNEQQQFCAYLMMQNLSLTHQMNSERRICEGTFIHGPGGVGKSYLITFLLKLAQDMNFHYVTLCPTQQAVQNILNLSQRRNIKNSNVKTIHSFFKLTENQSIEKIYQLIENFLEHQGINQFENTNQIYQHLVKFRYLNYETLQKEFEKLDLIIIEEVSMMNPLFLTVVDLYGQISRQCNQPFGGIQVFLFGDSYQLQPIQETRKKICYFDSIVMRKAYFTHMIELTQTVRQRDDMDYFQNILQPIRKGIFTQNQQNFNEQIQKLKQRVVPLRTIGQTPEILKEYETKQKENKQIISLYFKNVNADLENDKRAKRVIQQFEEEKKGKYYTKIAQFRKFIYQPIQVTFGERQTNQEIISQLLGQDYEFNENVLDQPLSYYSHFLLLPVGIRNFVAREISKIALRQSENSDIKFNKQRAVDELILFKKAEIIIRKNIDKNQQISNGQFAKIDDLYFDIEFNSLDHLKKLKQQQEYYIQENNLYMLIRQIKKQQPFPFTQKELKEFKKDCKQRNIMHVHNLRLRDISKFEKLSLYCKGFEPKLAKIILKIENVGRVELQAEDPKFVQKMLLSRDQIYNNMQGIIDSLILLKQEMEKLKKLKNQERRNQELLKFIKNQDLVRLLFTEIITENFNEQMIDRSVKNLQEFLYKMPQALDLQLHQFPINLGYARTIHTAQGATFENVMIDLDMPEKNTPGLLYTALSRVQKLSDLYFQGKFEENLFKVQVPKQISEFVEKNLIEADEYLKDEKLRQLKNYGMNEILCSVNDYAEGIRIAFNELKAKIRREQQRI